MTDQSIALLIAVPVGLVLGAVGFLCQRQRDKRRIQRHVERAGGKITKIRWAPFGRGWLAKGYRRLYRVAFRDAGGNQHQAYCSTAWLGGVYFTDDVVTRTEVIRVRDDRCAVCGYCLIGNTSGVCSECGAPTPGHGVATDR